MGASLKNCSVSSPVNTYWIDFEVGGERLRVSAAEVHKLFLCFYGDLYAIFAIHEIYVGFYDDFVGFFVMG